MMCCYSHANNAHCCCFCLFALIDGAMIVSHMNCILLPNSFKQIDSLQQ